MDFKNKKTKEVYTFLSKLKGENGEVVLNEKQQEDLYDIIENKNTAIVKKENDFIDEIINEFRKAYKQEHSIEYIIVNKGKERSAAVKLLSLYKTKYPEAKSIDVLNGLFGYFLTCCQIKDSYYNKNMSLSLIISKFNEINKIIHNERNSKTTDIDLAKIIHKNFNDKTG
jgi:hypothetical protein